MQFSQSFRQTQQLKMNPQLYQSIKLMELPIADLRERIEQELERNPALDIIEDKSLVPLNETENPNNTKYEFFETSSDPGRGGSEKASDEHRRFLEGALTRPESLQEHLLRQLQLEPIDNETRNIAETIIQNLNDDGFHIENPQILFKAKEEKIMEAIKVVRGLEPVGCCTAGYKESLIVQAELLTDFPKDRKLWHGVEVIINNLELMEKGKLPALTKMTGLNTNDLQLIYDVIKKFSPFPGRVFAAADIRYVIPDIRVIREKEELTIKLNNEAFPVLGVNKFFDKLSAGEKDNPKDKSALKKEARIFARENVREARLFINHLSQRNKTLIRVAAAILDFQRNFFIKGPKYLAPLTLGDIAKELDIHETTVSRTANGKYMQTEWGIFEIRYFFTNSISGTGANRSKYSKESVKEIIKEIVEAEKSSSAQNGDKLSDLEISKLLEKKGIALARRTVAKYRGELDMGSSYTRKQ